MKRKEVMNLSSTIVKLWISFLFLFQSFQVMGQDSPSSPIDMGRLVPEESRKVKLFDFIFRELSQEVQNSFRYYLNENVVNDIHDRLSRVQRSGDPSQILSPEENRQFQINLARLKELESHYFQRWYLNIPMTGAIGVQSLLTRLMSPSPNLHSSGSLREEAMKLILPNALYENWNSPLPSEWHQGEGPRTWGELLTKFQEDPHFRMEWVEAFPGSLPQLLELTKIWAWEDTSVRRLNVFNRGSSREYWEFERQERSTVPNRFQAVLNEDFAQVFEIEYAPTVFFNRVSRVEVSGEVVSYQIEAIEKGRTMEPIVGYNENQQNRRVFLTSSVMRKLKMDEFIQRNYLQDGSLSLFLGPRTLQLNQVQDLYSLNPTLVASVGQFGFSVTGGRAQTISVRTDTPEEQLLKWYASLVDIIDFANSPDVDAWFNKNVRLVLRAVVAGVGSGGMNPVVNPSTARNPESGAMSCQRVFEN